jgi:hypothetical protein
MNTTTTNDIDDDKNYLSKDEAYDIIRTALGNI